MKIWVLCISVFSIFLVQAQEPADSLIYYGLHQLRESDKNASAVDDCIDEVGLIFEIGNFNERDSLHQLLTEAVEISTQCEYRKGVAMLNYLMGKYYLSGGKEYSQAVPKLLEALSLYEEMGDSLGISKCYMQLGLIGYITEYYGEAIRNFEISLQYSSYPASHYLMAISFTEIGEYAKAKHHFAQAIKSYSDSSDYQRLSESYMYLGRLYVEEGKLDSAYYFMRMAILEREKLPAHTFPETRTQAILAQYYLKASMLDSAEFYALKSLEERSVSDEISAIISTSVLSQVYEQTGEYEKAYEYLQEHFELNNKNLTGATRQKIAEMRSLFEFNKQMAEEQLRHEEEIRNENQTKYTLLVIGAFILMITGGLWSRLNYIGKSRKALEEEKILSEQLLLNILPGEIAEELKESGKAEARNFDNVSILFSDFIAFTEQAAKLNPNELVNEINYCFAAFDRIADKYGIEKIKTIGDAYMAVGGLPIPSDEAVVNTLLAALEMQEFITRHKAEMDKLGKTAFHMRIGVHTGSVVAGIVGTKKFQYDIWGDAVNTASRMETHGELGKVNISQFTYDLVKNRTCFQFESRGKILAKGIGEVEMYFCSRCPDDIEPSFEEANEAILSRMKAELSTNLFYHCPEHSESVMEAVIRISKAEGLSEREQKLVVTAAAYHDCGFLEKYKNHEMESCKIARRMLPKFSFSEVEIETICQMIMATRIPQSPKNQLDRVLCDADLDYLGGDQYHEIADGLFLEINACLERLTVEDWLKMQVSFLESHQYWTAYSLKERSAGKAKVLQDLKTEMEG